MSAPVLALDLGGTDLKAALCAEDGGLLAFTRRPSRVEESAAAPFEAMSAAAPISARPPAWFWRPASAAPARLIRRPERWWTAPRTCRTGGTSRSARD